MENIYLEIGKRIRQQRKAHGLTREEFAENLSTTMQYISRLERAKTRYQSNICTESPMHWTVQFTPCCQPRSYPKENSFRRS
ncbi:helix-turn-helix transcriptional regulator [Gemmiger formicilis]|nr:helix-turn-helix transcriptional regulator [Gemmiger formicilis]